MLKSIKKPFLLLFTLLVLCSCSQGGTADQDVSSAREAYDKGFYLEAESSYERYLQKEPEGKFRREAWTRLLEIARNVKGDREKAIGLLEAMYLEFGDDKEAVYDLMFDLGDLYDQRGDRTKALESWEKCLEMVVDDPQKTVKVQLRMVAIYRTQKHYDLVLEMLQGCKQIQTDPETRAKCLFELAQTYSYTQNLNKARGILEEILTIKEAPEEIRDLSIFLLVDVYEDAGETDRAKKLLESVRDSYPNPKAVESRLESLNKK